MSAGASTLKKDMVLGDKIKKTYENKTVQRKSKPKQ